MLKINRSAVNRHKTKFSQSVLKPLTQEMHEIAVAWCPVDSGDLQSSGRVVQGDEPYSMRLVFGGTPRSIPIGGLTPKGRIVEGDRVDYADEADSGEYMREAERYGRRWSWRG